ncbi:response regulator [bacterium]|nr:response regulator [bacterium]
MRPVADGTPGEVRADEPRRTEGRDTMNHPRILVVDDDLELLEALSIRLEASHYEVLAASTGEDAVRLARREAIDLVLLDIGLPCGDGHTVSERLKADPTTAGLPIVLLSARTSSTDYDRAWDNGVTKYLTKPFETDELLLAVETALDGSGALAPA